jgi:phosphatidylglycerol:prolipoprotein diacylglycerol transferase
VLSEIDVLGLSIKTFGLFFGLNFVLVGLIAARRLKELGKPVDWAYEMTFAALIGGLVGSRLWWVLDNLDEVQDDVLGGLFGGSGLTWYGGLIGGAITVSLWAWRRGMLNLSLLDLAATPLALGYAVGRIGCQVAADGTTASRGTGRGRWRTPTASCRRTTWCTRRRSTSRSP